MDNPGSFLSGLRETQESWNRIYTDVEKPVKVLEQRAASGCPACVLDAVEDLCRVTIKTSERDRTSQMVEESRKAIEEAERTGQSSSIEKVLPGLDELQEQMMDKMFPLQFDLEELTTDFLAKYKEKMKALEIAHKKYQALKGMRQAVRATLTRVDWRKDDPEGFKKARPEVVSEAAPGRAAPQTGPAGAEDLAAQEAENDDVDDDNEAEADGASLMDPKKPDEEDLRRNHPGSADHPLGCRACHFQGGLCWKGYSCSFCHICPKPKRKSKHQRDVDKRRQERYKQVKEDLGITCLDELTKIDDSRRQIMTSSEELKKRVKEAYASRCESKKDYVRDIVQKMQVAMDIYHSQVPDLLEPAKNQNDPIKNAAELCSLWPEEENVVIMGPKSEPPPPPLPKISDWGPPDYISAIPAYVPLHHQ